LRYSFAAVFFRLAAEKLVMKTQYDTMNYKKAKMGIEG
jgi:hypothetical protein